MADPGHMTHLRTNFLFREVPDKSSKLRVNSPFNKVFLSTITHSRTANFLFREVPDKSCTRECLNIFICFLCSCIYLLLTYTL